MSDVVVDASVAVELLALGSPRLRQRVRGVTRHAPHLADAEVGSILRRWAAAGRVDAITAARALQVVGRVIDRRYDHGPLSVGAWALRHNVGYFDALYVSLAAALTVPLLTKDARLAGAPDLPCEVEVV